ncbi:hypothetical protein TNCV_3791201 [Trichonephila clavipes]|nr:hypothetical protein TNCV_3791201 [Trichonephila clavipes]
MHRSPTRRFWARNHDMPAMIRYLDHRATAALAPYEMKEITIRIASSTNQEMADIHFIYGVEFGNAPRLYGERFPSRRLPNQKTSKRLSRRNRFVCQWDVRHRAHQDLKSVNSRSNRRRALYPPPQM